MGNIYACYVVCIDGLGAFVMGVNMGVSYRVGDFWAWLIEYLLVHVSLSYRVGVLVLWVCLIK